jgi:hypothetical protein
MKVCGGSLKSPDELSCFFVPPSRDGMEFIQDIAKIEFGNVLLEQ